MVAACMDSVRVFYKNYPLGFVDTLTGAGRYFAFHIPFIFRRVCCCEKSQIPNLIQVSEQLYRGGQPNKEGFETLCQRYDVKTIVNLRVVDSDKALLKEANLSDQVESHLVYFDPDTGKEDPDVTRQAAQNAAMAFLRIMKESSGVVFLHCYYGKERTGTLVAIERMVFENWSSEDAIAELRSDPDFHEKRHPQLVPFVQGFDVAAAKRQLKID